MFKRIIDFVKKVAAIFNKRDMKSVIGAEPVITDAMTERIGEWLKMYRGEAPWLDDYVKSLRLEQGICREFADTALSELEIAVSDKKLDEMLKAFVMSGLNENLQAGLAAGSFIIKPLGEDKAEFVTADRFIPVSFRQDGRLTDVVFISVKKISDSSFYFRFERHELTNQGLRISNFAYHSSSEKNIGSPCPLSEVDEWASLPEEILYPKMTEVDFGYYRNPIKNEIDGTFCGVSIFDSAIELIKKADVQFGRLEWEFESGERAINVDSTALRPTSTTDSKGRTVFEAPKLNKRLYRVLNLETDNGDLYKEFSPEFRDGNIINGLEQIKRNIEFNVGLSYGDLSDINVVEKTATEIKHAKQRKYNRVNAIETNLKKCMEDFCRGLAFYNGRLTTNYEFTCSFSDSILTDEETERKQDIQDISLGIMQPYEYRMKWYGEDEKTAKAKIAEGTAEVIE